MSEKERVKQVIYWLFSQKIVNSQEELATKMGYNKSSISQIVSGKKPVSKKFIKNLCKLSEKINEVYLFNGIGGMISDQRNISSETFDVNVNEKQNTQYEIIKIRDKEIKRLHQYNKYLMQEMAKKDTRIAELTKEIIALKRS